MIDGPKRAHKLSSTGKASEGCSRLPTSHVCAAADGGREDCCRSAAGASGGDGGLLVSTVLPDAFASLARCNAADAGAAVGSATGVGALLVAGASTAVVPATQSSYCLSGTMGSIGPNALAGALLLLVASVKPQPHSGFEED